LQRLGLATSNFAGRWGLPRPIIKSHAEEKGARLWTRGVPKIWRPSLNIYTMSEASEFKFGKQLGFSKAYIKSHTEEKVGVALG